jgi:ADP-ribose pyrophosphatase
MPAELAWETLAAETAYECPGFTIAHEDVRLPDGTETEYDYLVDDPAVVVLPFTPDGDVVVIDEWRQAVKRVNRGLPAGSMEPHDDTVETAARRELTEETGYVAGDVTSLTSLEPANGITDAVHHYVVAHDCTPDGEQNLDFNESIRVDTTTMAALRDAVRDDTVTDGRTALGVLLYDFFG